MAKLLTVDLFAGLAATAWAVAVTLGAPLGELLSAEMAAGFALAALGRWYLSARAKRKALAAEPDK